MELASPFGLDGSMSTVKAFLVKMYWNYFNKLNVSSLIPPAPGIMCALAVVVHLYTCTNFHQGRLTS